MNDRPILPQLEHLLIRAARNRAAPRSGFRRGVLAVAVTSLVLAAAAGAATGVFQLAGGKTADGPFTIQSKVEDHPDGGSICLELIFADRGSAHGCGSPPSVSKPFGLVIADPLSGGAERVVYGLVADSIAHVRVLGGGGEVEVPTGEQADLPGRFFSAVAPRGSQMVLIGYDSDGSEVARLGSLQPPADPPLSKSEAIEQGDPAGFAPTVNATTRYLYRGDSIDPATARRRQLACLEGFGAVARCYDSEAEAEADDRRP